MDKKHTVIIGGTTSIAKDILNVFNKNNHKITTSHFSNESLVSEFKSIYLDCENNDSIFNFHNEILKFPLIDNLIFLTGILPGKSLNSYALNEIDCTININFNSIAKITNLLHNHFKPKSQILLMSSISGQRGSFDPIYAASKSAIIGFGKSLSQTLAPTTRTNILAPSLVNHSSMYDEMAAERRDFHKKDNPLNQLLTKKKLADIIYELTTDKWDHLNGAVIPLNGGAYV